MVKLERNPIMKSKKRAAHKSCRASSTFVFAALHLPRAPSCRCGHGGGFRTPSILEIHDPLSFRPHVLDGNVVSSSRARARSYFRFDRRIENVTGFNTVSNSSRYRSTRASLLPPKLHKIDSRLLQTKAVRIFFRSPPRIYGETAPDLRFPPALRSPQNKAAN